MTETEEQELFCSRCQDRQMFKKVAEGWQCEMCGHIVADEYEAENDEDTEVEEEDVF